MSARSKAEDKLIAAGLIVDKTQTSEDYSDNKIFVLTDTYSRNAGSGGVQLSVIATANVGHSNELDDIIDKIIDTLHIKAYAFTYNTVPIPGRGEVLADSVEMIASTNEHHR